MSPVSAVMAAMKPMVPLLWMPRGWTVLLRQAGLVLVGPVWMLLRWGIRIHPLERPGAALMAVVVPMAAGVSSALDGAAVSGEGPLSKLVLRVPGGANVMVTTVR